MRSRNSMPSTIVSGLLLGGCFMATLEYKNHTIISYVRPSKDHKQFLPGAIVRWKSSYGRLTTYFLRSEKQCRTTKHAHATALRQAKAWIRRNLSDAMSP